MKVKPAANTLLESGLRLPFGDEDEARTQQEGDDDNERSTQCVFSQYNPSDLLKPLQNEFLEYVHNHDNALSLAVNDSARDKLFEQVYEKGDLLGEGGFALVFHCQHKENGKTYAVKEVIKEDYEHLSSRGVDAIRDEISCLKQLKEYPHFVRLLDVFDEVERTYLIMEEMMGGDLLDKLAEIEVYPESAARKVSRTLLEAISFCHKRRIAHRDIKPENILLVKEDDISQVKLADFGCAKRWKRPNEMVTLCGSPQYVAPEVVGEQRAEGEGYNAQCDLWSCGVVIFILLGGYAPFESEDEHELLDLICNADYEFDEEYWDDVSQQPKCLITQLLQVNPKKRWTARQALNSPWLRRRDGDWVKGMDDSMSKGNSSHSGSSSTFGAWLEMRNSMRNLMASPGTGSGTGSLSSYLSKKHPRPKPQHKEYDGKDESGRTETEDVSTEFAEWTSEVEDSSASFAEGPLTPKPLEAKGEEEVSPKPAFSLTLPTI